MKTDNSFGSANNLGSIRKRKTARGAVDRSDKFDFFQFRLRDASSVSLEARGNLKSNLVVQLFDNKRKKAGKVTFKQGRNAISLDRELAKGKHFIRVRSKGKGSKYKLRLTAEKSDNTIDLANNLGVLTNTLRGSDSVGPKDEADFYRFRLNRNSDLEVDFNSPSAGVNVELIFDANNNGRVDDGEEIDSDASSSFNSSGNFTEPLPFGTYYLKVEPSSSVSDTTTNYNFSLVGTNQAGNVVPEPGNTIGTASTIASFPATRSVEDYVGTVVDPIDYYRITLNQNGNLEGTVTTQSQRGVDVDLILDRNNNGLVDTGEIVDGVDLTGLTRSFSEPLPKGTYFIQVQPRGSSSSTQYKLDLVVNGKPGNVTPEAGNTIPQAFNLGSLSTTRNIKDYVGVVDDSDFYKFTLNQNSDVETTFITESGRGLDIDLIIDQNGNGLVDDQEILDGVDISGTTRNFIEALPKGTYFIKVAPRFSGTSTQYELNLVPTAAPSNFSPEPGNTIRTAANLGVLGTRTARDYVGTLDTDDFYRFSIGQTRTVEVTSITQSSFGLDVDLIADRNNNGLVDSGEILDGRDTSGLSRSFSEELTAGTYFLRVLPRFSNRSTQYELNVVATA